jgi:hypothetical protein
LLALSLFERAFVAHLTADWIFQNDWMAANKSSLKHPSAWIHAGIHALFLSIALGWIGGLVLGLLHALIDTRVPLNWWQHVFRQTREGYTADITRIMVDQSMHILSIALWIVLAGWLGIG